MSSAAAVAALHPMDGWLTHANLWVRRVRKATRCLGV